MTIESISLEGLWSEQDEKRRQMQISKAAPSIVQSRMMQQEGATLDPHREMKFGATATATAIPGSVPMTN